jgi:hypothetical protein
MGPLLRRDWQGMPPVSTFKNASKAARLARRRVLDAIGAPVWGTATRVFAI